ncbi:MAG: hypothetical protein MJ087_01870 [Lachnospiraceae bacterium]|nr:hypothetical protein [Lachnospiraceae bacterium]
MDLKHELVDLCNREIGYIQEIREDMNQLVEMSDKELIVLIEKAYKFHQIQEQLWDEVCEGNITRKDKMILLAKRQEIRDDMKAVRDTEREIKQVESQIERNKREIRKVYERENRDIEKEKKAMFSFMGFGVVSFVMIILHLLLLRFHRLEPVVLAILLIVVPIALSFYFYRQYRQFADGRYEDDEIERLEEDIYLNEEILKNDKEYISYLEKKFEIVYGALDEKSWASFPAVERAITRLKNHPEWMKTQTDYYAIMEILQFKQKDIYAYIPEIFLDEKAEAAFTDAVNLKMRQLDEYLVETVETAE